MGGYGGGRLTSAVAGECRLHLLKPAFDFPSYRRPPLHMKRPMLLSRKSRF